MIIYKLALSTIGINPHRSANVRKYYPAMSQASTARARGSTVDRGIAYDYKLYHDKIITLTIFFYL